MSRPTEPVFTARRQRRAGLAQLALALALPLAGAAVALFTAWLIGVALGPVPGLLLGCLVGLATIWLTLDWAALGWYNRRLRADLTERLRQLGELTCDPAEPSVYFVGLAHPDRQHIPRWDTDDEIGFLRLTFDGLEYRGDRTRWEVSYDRIESLDLVPVGAGLPRACRRLRLVFRDGEPFDEVLLCSREGDRLSSGNAITRTLGEALQQRLDRRRAGRLTADLAEPLASSIDADH